MLEVNFWDENCRHLSKEDGRYSMVHEKISKNVKFVRDLKEWDGITIFTDQHLNTDTINSVSSKIKIGWLVENRNIYNIYFPVNTKINGEVNGEKVHSQKPYSQLSSSFIKKNIENIN